MPDCPRCGWPLDPDAATCFACAQGVPKRFAPGHFRVSPIRRLLTGELAIGAGVGVAAFGVLFAVHFLLTGKPLMGVPTLWPALTLSFSEALLTFAFFGAMLGRCVGCVWRVLRPIYLALFDSRTFLREHGTPEKRRIVRKTRA